MIFKIEFTITAEEELTDIFDYIAYEQSLPETATELIEKLYTAIASLSRMPERFRRFEHEPWFSQGLRVQFCSSYGIYYTVDKQHCVVRIHHVLSNRVNAVRWLKMS